MTMTGVLAAGFGLGVMVGILVMTLASRKAYCDGFYDALDQVGEKRREEFHTEGFGQ